MKDSKISAADSALDVKNSSASKEEPLKIEFDPYCFSEAFKQLKKDKDYFVCIKLKSADAYITDKKPRESKNLFVYKFRKGHNASETKYTLRKEIPLVCYSTVRKMIGTKAADALECNFWLDNPHYKTGPQMKTYFLCRVERIKEEIENKKK